MKKKIIILVIIVLAVILSVIIIKKHKSNYEYNIAQITSYEYFTIVSNEKQGIINKNGEIIVDTKYTNIIIPNPQKDIFFCYNGEELEVLNSKKERLYTNFEKVEPIKLKNVATTLNYEKSVLKFKKGDNYGLIDLEGKIIAKSEYQSIENLQLCEGIFLIKQNNKYGIMNLKGTIIIKPAYDSISSDGFYTEKDGYRKSGYIVSNKTDDGYRYGYVSNNGKKYLNASYTSVARIWKNLSTKEIYLIVSQNGKYGIYNKDKNIIKEEYQSIEYDESSNLVILEKNKKFGMASLDGKMVILVENSELETKGIYIYAKKDLENIVYDKNGNKINISFNKAIYETENENYRISTLENNDKIYYGIVDKNGNTLVNEKYEYVEYAFGTYFIAKKEDGKLGIISSNGKEVIEFKYNILQKLKGKNVLQAVNNADGITDLYASNLKLILSLKNANINNQEGYIKITSDKETIYLDEEGNKISEDSDIVRNSSKLQEPDTIGKYKKVQFTLENVYYVAE